MDTGAVGSSSGLSAASSPNQAASALSGEDFFQLLVTQLTHQDPFEPTSNEELLQQISSIREMDLSTTLVDSLKSLTGQQRFGSAANLIGKYVHAQPNPDDTSGTALSGLVVGMSFGDDGQAILHLGNGSQVPMDQVESISDAGSYAQSLVGQMVAGISQSLFGDAVAVQGLVTGVNTTQPGQIMLELDTGDVLALDQVLQVQPLEEPAAA